MADPTQDVPTQEVYVGPRPFERSERGLFFGRDREISELLSLVISSRVVICYAPSGAGKTSLINAGLLPRLEEEGFEVLPSMRVRGLVPEGIDPGKVPNIYMFHAMLGLAGETKAPGEQLGRTLAEYLSTRPHRNDQDDFPEPRILIFDQFEELLTSYPERWQEREGFFQQVRDALQTDPLLRALFVFREDFLARFEPYLRLLKPVAQARFRLPLLGPEGALAAITGPLRGTGRRFKEGAAAALVEELLKVRVETAQGEAVEVVGENVEPVQLQVVCRNLWTSLPPDVQEISSEHLKAYGDVDQALKGFYEACLADARSGQGAREPALREWFEEQLITPAGTRGIVFRDAALTAGLPNKVVDFLENRHLVRGEWRAGSRWYELTHDRLIEPIQEANGLWRAQRRSRRNRWVMTGAFLLLTSILAASLFIVRPATPYQEVSAATVTAAQLNLSAAEGTAAVAQEDAAFSKSRQLAAEALLANDPELALLLAIEANRQANTQEARGSLHKILSRQPVINENFLRELNPEIVSPRIVKRLEGHENWVVSVAFSPDGRRLVSGSADTKLILWDVATGEAIGDPLSGHTSNVQSVAFSPDGALIASSSLDTQVLLWDAYSGERIGAPLLGHVGLVTCVAFSPDGKRLASGGDDGTIRIWDVSTGEPLDVVPPRVSVWSLAWSPDGKFLASGGADSTVRLWDAETLSEVRALRGHNDVVRSVAWSPDSLFLASGSVVGEVFLWDVASSELITRPLRENVQPVRTVAFDPSGTILAVGRDDGTITLWDTRSERMLGEPLKGHDKQVYSLAFSPDGRQMASGSIDQTVVLWDLFAPTRSIAFSPSGELLAASEGTVISVWDPGVVTIPVAILSGHTEDVLVLEFYSEGILASAGLDDTIRLWDVRSRKGIGPTLLKHGDDVLTLDISPDGSTLASGGQDGNVLLWDLATYQQLSPPLFAHTSPVIKVLYGEGGETLQLADRDGSLITLDLAMSTDQVEVLPAAQEGIPIVSLEFSQNGQVVASFQKAETTIIEEKVGFLLSGADSEPIQRGMILAHEGEYKSYEEAMNTLEEMRGGISHEAPSNQRSLMLVEDVFTIKGRGTVVTGTVTQGSLKVGDHVDLFDVSNQVQKVVINQIEKYLSKEELTLAVEITTFSIYDRVSGEIIHPNRATQVTGFNGIAFSPDGTYTATAGEHIVSIFDTGSGDEITTLSFGGRTFNSLSFQPDGKTLAIGTEDGTVLLWDLGLLFEGTELEPYLDMACSRTNRNFSDDEWVQYFFIIPTGESLEIPKTCPNLP